MTKENKINRTEKRKENENKRTKPAKRRVKHKIERGRGKQ